ncbi:MAG: YfbR-like 5'-deoxynucleotidase [Candidatus Paceibacterota bacterium]
MKNNRPLLWKNLEKDLKKIKRYHKFKIMFYRTNDLIHSRRVKLLLDTVIPFVKRIYPNFNSKKARLIALHHDDFEIALEGGDIPLQFKLMMSEIELMDLKQKEVLAAETISALYSKTIDGYNYKQILFHAIFKDCIEAQVVSFVDKVDAYCEAIHEVLAGNTVFLEPIINYNMRTFNNLSENFSLIKKLFFSTPNNFFSFPVVDLRGFFEYGNIGSTSHNLETINRKTEIPHYEKWKEVTIRKIGIDVLINQVEFHKK